jgi:uncharacterized protein (DUF1330 family)
VPVTEIDPAGLDAAVAALPPGEPLFMINLLRFRDQADYGGDTDLAPCTGREAYFTRYVPAFTETVRPHGATALVFGGDVVGHVVGPADDVWDTVALVRYDSIEVFRNLIADPAYLRTAAPHRVAALADWRLFATTSIG